MATSLLIYLFSFEVAASGSFVLFCFFFSLFFPRGKSYFNLLVGGLRDSSTAGQIMTYVLEAFISFGAGWKGLGVSKEPILFYISKTFFLQFLKFFYMFFTFLLLHVSVFVCLFVHKCVVVQLSVSYCYLNVRLKGLQTIRAHSFLNFISLTTKKKD